MSRTVCTGAAMLAAAATWAAAGSDETVQAAKQVLKDNQAAIVWVTAVVKSQMSGRGAMFGPGREQKVECLGTVIDASGLTVVSACSLDPMILVSLFLQGMSDQDADQDKYSSRSDISNIKIRLGDRQEIPARLVLTDPDLDLSFLAPEKPEGKDLPAFAPIRLNAPATPQLLDDVIVLGRLGKSLDRQPWVTITRIAALVNKPRPFYVPSEGGQPTLGIPAFAADRRPIGLLVLRKSPTAASSGMMNMGAAQNLMPVILPAADVMEVAAQALKKGPAAPEPKSEKTEK